MFCPKKMCVSTGRNIEDTGVLTSVNNREEIYVSPDVINNGSSIVLHFYIWLY